MQPTQKSKVEEIIDADEELRDQVNGHLSDSDENDDVQAASTSQSPDADSSKKSKKKKKKSKLSKALNALKGSSSSTPLAADDIPQELVDVVVAKVREEHGQNAPGTDEASVRMALAQMGIKDVVQGKAGISGRGRKDLGEHKFWATQPVPQMGEGPPVEDGYIEPPIPIDLVRKDPYPLPKEFEWSTIDLNDPNQTKEVYDLLSLNYVEDEHAAFRFQYTAEFLQWALKPPGYHKEWHVGVRVASNKRLVAFISGVPLTLRVREHIVKASEINYLCVLKKLRSKRLAPVLIKEVTRRCHLTGIFQAIYTAGVLLPTPVATCRYFHRPINIPKLVDVKFTYIPRTMTLARMMRLNKLPPTPKLADNLREMTEKDIPQVHALYVRYMQRFSMAPEMSAIELKHHLLSGLGEGEPPTEWKGRREKQVVWAYVVEDPRTRKITDFFSFYSLPSTIMQHEKHKLLEAAYLFYYATDVAFAPGADLEDRLKKRVQDLIGDALSIAAGANFDVFNALTLMDNVDFLQELKFGAGDGHLNYYLYNWRTAPMAGSTEVDSVPAGRGVGVVML